MPPPPERSLGRLRPLAELAPEALGLALWRAAHDAPVWSALPPERRRNACRAPTPAVLARHAAARAAAPELAGALAAFLEMLADPAALDAARLADAYGAAAAWAEERGWMGAAIPLAEAAATVQPESAARCNAAGRVCRRAAEHTRAEQWYLRGIGLAKESGDAKGYIDAQLGTGALVQDRGSTDRARRHYEMAARRARRAGYRALAADAFHDLLSIAVESGRQDLAVGYAESALATLPARRGTLPHLSHDVALSLIYVGEYGRAVTVLSLAAPLIRESDQSLVRSTLAWAHACENRRDAFEAERRIAEDLANRYPGLAPGTFLHLAEGSRAVGEWNEAERLALAALEFARAREARNIERKATDLLHAIQNGSPAPEPDMDGFATRRQSLVLNLQLRLRRWEERR